MPGRATSPIADAVEITPSSQLLGDNLQISCVTSLEGFEALHKEWDDLFERTAEPQQVFQRHIFLRHWARHYLDPKTQLCILIGRIDGRLVTLWPLVRRRKLGFDVLGFMGAPVTQFGDVLVEAGENRHALLEAGWNAVASLGADLFEARRVRADAALCGSVIPSGASLPGDVQAPFASLSRRVTADGPGIAYSARERSNYRRRLRRLREHGDITFTEPEPGSTAATAAAAAITIKKNWLLENAILSPTVMDSRFQAFFEDLAGDPGAGLCASTIACDGRPIGVDLSFDCKGHTFGHVLATDPGYDREGLGRLLIHRTFAAAADRGSRVFDLLAPADGYKMQHADGLVAVSDYAFAFSWRGWLLRELVMARLQPAAKVLAKRLPSALVRRLAKHKI
ncbi:GNAT family N-acetyltransferase [Ensifer sp. T173]|jgi:CelD/BcsL family acetyltransferase involved in cellulose biosynthesis|uniref:GNAT family N-acetyltransferase n=1 Tax=Ensifer canadensis TaxID=555315 RepID=A0AAW4FQS5_9HYPH|nr:MULTISPECIES: GNAT family N-acetyltransferase [Ensifer]MBM3093687.1 GNAT family N-acetyltransferase [Ensifer canadensis]NOV18337.1 GNAT family N-acetyltransferase [Ensifer canadensis]PSS63528.1 GNAT family N-acetyltransferase [Ensifer sp. NM-2]UBI75119.1 GNAT family N-acetyltransferase [Ensifer canadensis]